MTTRTLKRTVSCLSLAIYLVAGSLMFGQELCVAADGHVALELAHQGECEQETVRHHERTSTHEHLAAACADHPCADFALEHSAWRSSASDPDLAHTPLVAFAILSPRLGTTPLGLGEHRRSALPIEVASLQSRPTVVLLV